MWSYPVFFCVTFVQLMIGCRQIRAEPTGTYIAGVYVYTDHLGVQQKVYYIADSKGFRLLPGDSKDNEVSDATKLVESTDPADPDDPCDPADPVDSTEPTDYQPVEVAENEPVELAEPSESTEATKEIDRELPTELPRIASPPFESNKFK